MKLVQVKEYTAPKLASRETDVLKPFSDLDFKLLQKDTKFLLSFS